MYGKKLYGRTLQESISSDLSSSSNSSVCSNATYQVFAQVAEENGRHDILESYHKAYIEKALEGNCPVHTFSLFVKSMEAFQKMARIEKSMDQPLFQEILSSGIGCISGRSQAGHPILYLRAHKGIRHYKKGTPQGDAVVRVYVYLFQLLFLRSFPYFDVVIIFDETCRGLLDFNVMVLSETSNIVRKMFGPYKPNELWISGCKLRIGISSKIWMNITRNGHGSSHAIKDRSDVLDIVENEADVPEWWFGDGQGFRPSMHRNNLWEWERCLGGKHKPITIRDIFNPSEMWEDIELSESENPTPSTGRNSDALATIPEEDCGEDGL